VNVADLTDQLHLPQLPERLVEVERLLADVARRGNPALREPSLRVIQGGGKRLRPVLTLAAAHAAGGDLHDGAIAAAASLELVHVGSLVHDDIIDHAELRRGVPTVNSVEGVPHALLVGDYLLALAGSLAASVNQAVAASLATAITELCIGQSLETASVGNASRSVDEYLASIDGKTAALVRASCRIGAQAVDAPAGTVEALAAFGTRFGLAFQIVDDVLDVVADTAELGKPAGHDLLEGVFTLPTIITLQEQPELKAALDGQVATPALVDEVLEAMRACDAIARARAMAEELAEDAAAELAGLPPSPQRDGLAALARWYVDAALA